MKRTIKDKYPEELEAFVMNATGHVGKLLLENNAPPGVVIMMAVQKNDQFHFCEFEGIEDLVRVSRSHEDFKESIKEIAQKINPIVFSISTFAKKEELSSLHKELKKDMEELTDSYLIRFETHDLTKIAIVGKSEKTGAIRMNHTQWMLKEDYSEVIDYYLTENYSELAQILKDQLGHMLN